MYNKKEESKEHWVTECESFDEKTVDELNKKLSEVHPDKFIFASPGELIYVPVRTETGYIPMPMKNDKGEYLRSYVIYYKRNPNIKVNPDDAREKKMFNISDIGNESKVRLKI